MVKQQINKLIYVLKYSHNWLFDSGTRCMEVFNSIGLICIGTIFFTNNTYLINLPSYEKFEYVNPPEYWLLVTVLGILNFVAMTIPSLKANQVSGYLMLWSAVVWSVIAVTFNLDVSKLTTAAVIYGLLAFFCTLTGIRLLLLNRAEEEEQERKNKCKLMED